MKNDTQSEKETCRIAHAIVELVERTNGPMTLVQVEREIAGFAKHEPPSWNSCNYPCQRRDVFLRAR